MDPQLKLAVINNFVFQDTFQLILIDVLEKGDKSKFNKICKNAYPEYEGTNKCAYNIAKSLAWTYSFLKKELSSNQEDWTWGHVHYKEYTNAPFSLTPLRPFFHRQVINGGNSNTPNVSRFIVRFFENGL